MIRCLAASSVIALSAAPAMAQHHGSPASAPDPMAASLDALRHETGGQRQLSVMVDRLEYRSEDGHDAATLEAGAWYGGRLNRLWIKAEAEYSFDETAFEEARLEALWSRAVSPYFDIQAGLAHDLAPAAGRSHAVLGLQGLAPYWFEVDAAAYLSDRGELTAGLEAEYELHLTQRLILQPRAELGWSADAIPELGTGAGITGAEAGLRLRYEIVRQFAPYAGLDWHRAFGETADFARAAGEPVDGAVLVAGVRMWF